jgi:probable HAF family extracellular repeat protein
MRKLLLATFALLAGFSGASALAQSVSFRFIQQPTAPTWSNYALSYDGKTMAANFGGEIFLWKQGKGFVDLGPGDTLNSSIGISGDGTTVTSTIVNPDASTETGVWKQSTGWVHLGHPKQGCRIDQNWNSGYSVSFNGSMVVGLSWYCPGAQGYRWTTWDGFVTLSHQVGASSRATAVSGDGSTIVGFYESPTQGFRRPVRWTPGETDLFAGTQTPGEATAVTSDGSQIVGQAADTSGNGRAFYYTNTNGLVDIGTTSGLPTDQSIATGISDDGLVVGWSGDPFGAGIEAFLWRAKTPKSPPVSLKSWMQHAGVKLPKNLYLVTAIALSGDGSTIVGLWQDTNFKSGSWMARISDKDKDGVDGQSLE